MKEFTAMVEKKGGGTEAVIIKAHDKEGATKKQIAQGYAKVLWVL